MRHTHTPSLSPLNKVEKENVPLEAFHGKHSGGVDQNHIWFHQCQIALLEAEQVQRE